MSTYLVTGGAGFVGSHLVERLVKEGHEVRVLDNFISGFESNLEPFAKKIELVRGDIRDESVVKEIMSGVDFVLHQAALRAVQRSVSDPISTNEVNVGGTLNLLMAAREANVKRFVFASSSSAYGDSNEKVRREEQKPQPISPYAASKVAIEYYCSIFKRLYGLQAVSLRYFNVFGPRQSPYSQYALVIPIFMQKICDGEAIEIHGDGEQTRDFSYIDNIVDANIKACSTPKLNYDIYNVGCGSTYSINHLYKELSRLLKKSVDTIHTDPRQGDMRTTLADISRIQSDLKYRVLVDFQSGLKKTVDWFLSSRKTANKQN